ncbi:MAG TPA: hypothetical protein VF310_17820 [Vicinamibacteria bacterium]|jgi:hypothetical protein
MRAPAKGSVVLAAAALACSSGSGEATVHPATQREAIVAAVVRYQYRQFVYDTGEKLALCLTVEGEDGPGDPGPRLLKRLKSLPGLRPGSECSSDGEQVVVTETGAPALRLTVGAIQWKGSDDVQVASAYYRSAFSQARPTYRVVREHDGWVSLGPVMQLPVA